MRVALSACACPRRYGGFETLAAELSARLASRGHDAPCTVGEGGSTRAHASGRAPALRRDDAREVHRDRYLHRPVDLDAAPRRFDAILLVNAANALFAVVRGRRARRSPSTSTGSSVSQPSGVRSVGAGIGSRSGWRPSFPAIISNADVIERYYRERYDARSTMIPYGSTLLPRDPPPDLRPYGSNLVGTSCT